MQALVFDGADASVFYGRDADTIYKSTDGGRSWTEMPAELERGGSINGLFGLAAVPGASGTLFASTYAGLFKTTDGAKSWTKSGGGIPYSRVQCIAVDPASKAIYAGTEGEGVFKSRDGGATWTAAGKLGRVSVQFLRIDPDGSTIDAAVWKKGVFRSTDGGVTWARIGGEPPHPDVLTLAADPSSPGRLLVATGGGSVWRLDTAAVEKPEKPASPPAATPRPARKKP